MIPTLIFVIMIDLFYIQVLGLESATPALDSGVLNLFSNACWPTIIETGSTPAVDWRSILERNSQKLGATMVMRSLLCGEVMHNIAADPLTELKACQQAGLWLVLQHPGASQQILTMLVNEVVSSYKTNKPNTRFRLWIVVESVQSDLPDWVGKVSLRLRSEIFAPNNMQGLSASLADQINDETLRKAAQDQKLCKILGAFCMMHASIVLRQRQRPLGWIDGRATAEDFAAASNTLQLALWPTTRAAAGRPLDWPRIRSAAEVDYLGSAENPYDARTLCSIIRAYLHQGVLAQRYEAFPGLLIPNPPASASGNAGAKLKELLQSSLEPKDKQEWLGLHPFCVKADDPHRIDEVLELLSTLFFDGGATALPTDFTQNQLLSYESEQIHELAVLYNMDHSFQPSFSKIQSGSFKTQQRSGLSNQADSPSPATKGQIIRRVPSKNMNVGGKGKLTQIKGNRQVKRGSVTVIQSWERPDVAIWEGPVLNERESTVCRNARRILEAIAALQPTYTPVVSTRSGQKSILMSHLLVELSAFKNVIKTAENLMIVINAVVKGITYRTSPGHLQRLWPHIQELEAGRMPLPILQLSWQCPNIDSWIQVKCSRWAPFQNNQAKIRRCCKCTHVSMLGRLYS